MFIDMSEHIKDSDLQENTGDVSAAENVSSASEEPKTDYKALYEATLKERDAAKEKSEQYEAENKKYKMKEEEIEKSEREKLPQEEQIRLALEEKEKELCEYRERLTRTEIEKEFSKKGYEETDYKDISDLIVLGFNDSKSDKSSSCVDLAVKILAFVDKAKEKAIETARNESIKGSAFLPRDTSEPSRKSGFAQYQEEQYKLRHPELLKK